MESSRRRKSWKSSRVAPELSGAFPRQPMREHLAQDLAPDRLVRRSRIGPPPAVMLHGFCGGDEAVRDGAEVGLGVIEAEDQAAGTDPAQRQSLGAQIILEHPVIARWLGIEDGP